MADTNVRKIAGRKKPLTTEQKVLLILGVCFMAYIFAFSYVPLAGWSLSLFKCKPGYGLNFACQKFVGLDNFVRL